MMRFAPRLIVVLLCATALAGCASGALSVADASKDKPAPAAAAPEKTPIDLESGIKQAVAQRNAGQYDDAIHTLSQLMLVASDDKRVVSEYGKALAQKGRAKDATDFLNRAIELSANDWTLYSALGVSYDQLGNQTAARTAYDHALTLKPNEPSVLNNYALSRMMAGDTDGARGLMARAQAAGGANDAKIAANIALVNKLASIKPAAAVTPKTAAAVSAQPQTQAKNDPTTNSQAAAKPVATATLPPAQNGPRSLTSPQQAQANNGVVMQAVPVDPLAGPVKATSHKSAMAKPAAAKSSKTADAQNAKPADTKPAEAKSTVQPASMTKTADKADGVPALRLAADALTP
jgi:Flp pilus assembly protein TadD